MASCPVGLGGRDAEARTGASATLAGMGIRALDTGGSFDDREQYVHCRRQLDQATDEWETGHRVPVDNGGTNDIDSLQSTCSDCNERKETLGDADYRRDVGVSYDGASGRRPAIPQAQGPVPEAAGFRAPAQATPRVSRSRRC